MATTDPFGTSIFGGQTSLAKQVPGTASAATQSTAAKPAAYKYAGQGWNDPLAQQMYQKYAFGGRLDMPFVQRLAKMGDPYTKPHPGVSYQNPIDPTTWGGSNQGEAVNQMIEGYKAAGGQGLYSQLAATNPEAVGWKAGQGRLNTTTGQTEYPQASGDWSSTLTSTGQPAGGSGSSHSLSPEVLKKMWRT